MRNKKVKLGLGILGIVCAVIISAYFLFHIELNFIEKDTLEYGSDLSELVASTNAEEMTFIVNDSNGEEVSEDQILIDEEYVVIVNASRFKYKKDFKKTIVFTDSIAPVVELIDSDIIFGYGSVITTDDILNVVSITNNYESNTFITLENEEILTKDSDIIVRFCDDSNNCHFEKIPYLVVDTTPPVFSVEQTEFSMTAGGKLPNFSEFVKARDLKDGDIELTIEGDWNSKKAGKYELLFVAVDSSGNRSEVPFTMEVKAKPKSSNSYSGGSYDANFEYDRSNPIVNAALNQVGDGGGCAIIAEIAINAVGASAWENVTFVDGEGVSYDARSLSPEGFLKIGREVSLSEIKPGDLLYFSMTASGSSHIAIYIGNEMAVHGNWEGTTQIKSMWGSKVSTPRVIRVME